MSLGRSRWSTGEAIAMNELEEQEQDDDIIEPVASSKKSFISIRKTDQLSEEFLAASTSITKPVLAGVVIGALLIGIVLATVLTIYVQDQSRHSTD